MTDASLPRGPRLPALLQTLLFFRWPLPFARRWQRRYGDVFTLRITGVGRVVYLADPGLIGELFALDGKQGHAGAVNSLLEPVTGPESILLLDGKRHLAERRLLSPAFHGEAIGKLEGVAREATARELETWKDGEVIATRPAMQRITFEVIARAVFGVDDAALRQRLLEAFEPVLNVPPTAVIPALRFNLGPLSPFGRFLRAMERLDRILLELIAKRRAEPPRSDILGALLAAEGENGKPLADRHVRDELVTLLLAGHETTATALAWALERLAHNGAALQEVREGLAEGRENSVEAAAAETLRVRPVVMDVGRRLSAPVELGGYWLPAGTTVMAGIYLVHFDRRHHADPTEFEPRRFAEGRPPKETWLPFGGGRRRCLGAGLAQTELRVILATILSDYVPEPCSERIERPRLHGVILTPDRGARLRMVRRRLPARAERRAYGDQGAMGATS